ncbi:GNAT family N-acetyltransferase [Marinomonas ostreistagni]|uniref:GNAT family N-acetyltransferase n=1 Tax=Marinomonas ostreistagni TaxID=359209 RepID=UPI00194FD128|nr:GNAT family N-acetyltransferase [Marinomonas ostreistagni]MBM6551490.1 GNAT family N-acetyltransferase [Marinomonas ostreistagni]
MALTFDWSQLSTLSALEFHELVQAREAVFVVEQNCAYQEVDEVDVHAWHLRVRLNGQLAACARVVAPGDKFALPSIGRVMTLKAFRQQKLGRPLMMEAMRFTETMYPGLGIQISGQLYLQAFYESLGFVKVSEPYDEDGILHIDMIKQAS